MWEKVEVKKVNILKNIFDMMDFYFKSEGNFIDLCEEYILIFILNEFGKVILFLWLFLF